MLWLSLRFPFLPLDLAGEREAAAPFVVVAAGQGAQRIVMANAAAAARGIRPGLTLAAALALDGGLRIRHRDAAAEQAALERLATVAANFSSQVALTADPGLLVEIGASQRLFGGLVPASRALIDACRDLGYHADAAVAPTPAGARLLARTGERRIVRRVETLLALAGPLPLTLAEIPAAACDSLAGIGVTDFAGLMALPRAEVARRFGDAVVSCIDRLSGARVEALRMFRPPPRFHARHEPGWAVERTEALGFILQRMLRELAAWLLVRQQALLRATITLHHDDHPPDVVELGLAEASGDAAHLLVLARAQLERLVLAAPVVALELDARECVALAGAPQDLFAAAAPREDLPRVLDRLRSRLGEHALHGVAVGADHRPERATHCVAPGSQPPSAAADARATANAAQELVVAPAPATRPLFLLRAPESLDDWLPRLGGVVGVSHVERIESGWWDGAPAARDYRQLITAVGVRLWVYAERPGATQWMVHGVFA